MRRRMRVWATENMKCSTKKTQIERWREQCLCVLLRRAIVSGLSDLFAFSFISICCWFVWFRTHQKCTVWNLQSLLMGNQFQVHFLSQLLEQSLYNQVPLPRPYRMFSNIFIITQQFMKWRWKCLMHSTTLLN